MSTPTTEPARAERLAREAARYVDLACAHGEALVLHPGLWARLAAARGASPEFIEAVLVEASARWEAAAARVLAEIADAAPKKRGRPLLAPTLDANVTGAKWQSRVEGMGWDWVENARADLAAVFHGDWRVNYAPAGRAA